MNTTTTMKSPAELAAWLLLGACESVTIEAGNEAMFFGVNEGENGVFDGAHSALSDGDTSRALELLHEAVHLAGEAVPNIKEGRNRTVRQRRAQDQRERLLNISLIALRLLEPLTTAPAAPSPVPAINLMTAADAAESFARALRAAAGQEGGVQ